MGFLSGKKIVRTLIVGVRTAQDTKMFATYNYGVYSFVVEYDNGSREIVEVKGNDPKAKEYLMYLDW